MTWIKALWQAIMAFFGSIKADKIKKQQEAQAVQDEIVQETQHEIEKIPNATDDELTDVVLDTGLVHTQNSSGSSNSDRTTHTDCYGRCSASTKTKQ